jgi:hypothetical protein
MLSHIVAGGSFSLDLALGWKMQRMGLKNTLKGAYPKSTRVMRPFGVL